MAKFWEVMKAFEEGKSTEAVRHSSGTRQVKAVKGKNGIEFYNQDNELFNRQNVGNDDFNKEWEIVELLDRKEFRVIQALFKLHGHGRSTRKIPELFENNSLKNAVDCVQRDYPEDIITVLGAVGISDTGEITILAQSGVAIDG